MTSELAAATFFATIADIRWFPEFQAICLFEIWAFGVAAVALAAEFAPFVFTRITEVGEMLAVPAMTARVESVFFDDLEMPPNLFRNRGRIFIYSLGNLPEGHTVPESRFDDDTLTER